MVADVFKDLEALSATNNAAVASTEKLADEASRLIRGSSESDTGQIVPDSTALGNVALAKLKQQSRKTACGRRFAEIEKILNLHFMSALLAQR